MSLGSINSLDNLSSTQDGVDFDFTTSGNTDPTKAVSQNSFENLTEKIKSKKCISQFVAKVCGMYSTYHENSKNKPKNNIYGTFEYYEMAGDTYFGAMKEKEVILFAQQKPWGDKKQLRQSMKQFLDLLKKEHGNWWISWDHESAKNV